MLAVKGIHHHIHTWAIFSEQALEVFEVTPEQGELDELSQELCKCLGYLNIEQSLRCGGHPVLCIFTIDPKRVQNNKVMGRSANVSAVSRVKACKVIKVRNA